MCYEPAKDSGDTMVLRGFRRILLEELLSGGFIFCGLSTSYSCPPTPRMPKMAPTYRATPKHTHESEDTR